MTFLIIVMAFFSCGAKVSADERIVTYSSSIHACYGNRTAVISNLETLDTGSYQLLGNFILFNNLATGEYWFNCIDENGGTETISFEVIPFPFQFKNKSALITPKQITYVIGDVITCVSKRGLAASRWQFVWASRSNFMPTYSKIHHKLVIDANFAAEVMYIYQCDTEFVIFNVLREPYNLRVFQDGEQSIKCTAEGSDLVYFWRVRNSRGELSFAPTEGNILQLKMSRNVYHRVACIVVSATDEEAHQEVTFYDKIELPKATIYNRKSVFTRSDYIGCDIDAKKVASKWYCGRDFDKKTYSVEGNHLFLDDDYFSISNILYLCKCTCSLVGLKSEQASANLTFRVIKSTDSSCLKAQYWYIAVEKYFSAICLFVIFASALGPFRHLSNVITSRRHKRCLAKSHSQ